LKNRCEENIEKSKRMSCSPPKITGLWSTEFPAGGEGMRKRFVNASPEYTGSWSIVNFGENQSVNSSPENTSSWMIEEFYEEGTCESNPSLVARDHGLMVGRGDLKGIFDPIRHSSPKITGFMVVRGALK